MKRSRIEQIEANQKRILQVREMVKDMLKRHPEVHNINIRQMKQYKHLFKKYYWECE